MLYATIPEIMEYLRYRLELPSASSSTLGAKVVEISSIEFIAAGVEADVNARLALMYVLPIPALAVEALAILKRIVCKLVVADLIPANFFASQNPTGGGDGGFATAMRNEALKELESYTAGHGMYYRDSSGNIPRTGNQIQQCVPLPGVFLKMHTDLNRPVQPCYAQVVKRDAPSVSINWGV